MKEGNIFLDERAMAELARKTLAELRDRGLPSAEFHRLEACLKQGRVGEAYVVSGLLKAVLNEISADASKRRLLQIYQELEHCCYSLVELSRSLSDVEVWQHYRSCGHETFDSFCIRVLEVSPARVRGLRSLRDRCLPRPGKATIALLFSWLFDAVEIMADAKAGEDPSGKRPESP